MHYVILGLGEEGVHYVILGRGRRIKVYQLTCPSSLGSSLYTRARWPIYSKHNKTGTRMY